MKKQRKKMNNKAQLDPEILTSPGFIILAVLAISATVLGWSMGPKMGFESRFPLWQLLIIIVGELVASYVIAARG